MIPALKHVPAALAIGLLVAWVILLRPTALGGPVTYTIVSGTSMEPVLHGGDLILMRERPTYQVGDIASYSVPEGQPGAGIAIVHRLVGGDGSSGYVTQGDNVDRRDPWTPTDREVIGKLFVQIPKLGYLFMLLHSPLALGSIAGGLTAFAILRRPSGSVADASATHDPSHERLTL